LYEQTIISPNPHLTISTSLHAVVTFTMPCTLVTLLGMHSEYAGLEPARVTPHAANDNLTQL